MPRAAYGISHHQPVGERSVIVAAMGIDGENVLAGTHQQHLFIADMTEQGLTGEFR